MSFWNTGTGVVITEVKQQPKQKKKPSFIGKMGNEISSFTRDIISSYKHL